MEKEKTSKIAGILSFLRYAAPIAEIAAIILLLSDVIPGLKTNEFFAFLILGVALIAALIINFLYFKFYLIESSKWNVERQSLTLKWEAEKALLMRKANYADVIPHINEAFQYVHDVYRNDQATKQDYLRAFDRFSTKLARSFTIITGVDCAVCIKVSKAAKNNSQNPVLNYQAVTIARDDLIPQRKNIDSDQIPHWYKDNTDFDFIFKNIGSSKGRRFLCNNLTCLPYYKNTSFLSYKFPLEGYPPNTNALDKEKNWPLQYISTIVVPICPSVSDKRTNEMILGFLCVDSKVPDKFNEQYDPELLIGCADGIFNPMLKFLKQLN